MFDLGTTREDADAILSYNTGIVKTLKEQKTYRHRVLTSPKRIAQVFYPTIREDAQTGELKGSWNAINVPYKQKHLLTPLIDLDRAIKVEQAKERGLSERVRSALEPSIGFLCLIFDRGETAVKIDVANYKLQAVNQLIDLERTIDDDDPSKLMYGPMFCWDAVIVHAYENNPSKQEWQRHSYPVSVHPKTNKMAGKIPANIWKAESVWKLCVEKNVHKQVFTEEELKAIDTYEGDPATLGNPMTDEEIAEELQKFPINPRGTRGGNYVFGDPKALWEKVTQMSLPLPSQDEIKMIEGHVAEEAKSEEVKVEDISDDWGLDDDAPNDVSEIAKETDRPDFTKAI